MISEFLFISDLHLSKDRPENTRRFIHFLDNRASGVEALYLLGDIFDIWVGDDDPGPPNREVIRHLRQLTDSGTQVFFQQGNRDFLIGPRFSDETGVRLMDDYTVIDLYGTPTLLMHGDLLCTDDVAYQAFRNKTRNPSWQRKMLSKPLFFRLLIAWWYQIRNNLEKGKKSLEIMDINQVTTKRILRKYGVKRLIHGHTHRPKIHEMNLDGETAYRFVLSQWEEQGSVLCWNSKGYRIETFD